MFEKVVKNESKELNESDVYSLIDSWGEFLEVRLKGDDWQAVKDEIWLAVKKQRLVFDNESESFTYALKKPIQDRDGNDIISILKIQDSDMQAKKEVSKYKEDMDRAAAFLKAYCKKMDGSEIEHGFITRMKTADQSIIQAVIMGFFVQAVPGPQ